MKATSHLQGRVVRKLVNVNPGLKVNWSITFSYLKMFFTSNVWCNLRLPQKLKGEQYKQNTTAKSYNIEIEILANPGLA